MESELELTELLAKLKAAPALKPDDAKKKKAISAHRDKIYALQEQLVRGMIMCGTCVMHDDVTCGTCDVWNVCGTCDA